MSITGSRLDLLTVPAVAEQLHCGRTVVLALIASGDLRASKIAGKWLVDPADVAAYVDSQSNRPRMRRRA